MPRASSGLGPARGAGLNLGCWGQNPCLLNWPEGQCFSEPMRWSSGETTQGLTALGGRCRAQGAQGLWPSLSTALLPRDAQASAPLLSSSLPLPVLSSRSPRLPTGCVFPTAQLLILHFTRTKGERGFSSEKKSQLHHLQSFPYDQNRNS